MPVYMDVHEVGPDVTADDIAKAHARDVECQNKYGVHYEKYYFNEKAGKIFCFCHAPDADAAKRVHKEAHGLLADHIIQVDPQMAALLMGAGEINTGGAAVFPGSKADNRDPVRTDELKNRVIKCADGESRRCCDRVAVALNDYLFC